jgi:thiol:disulfide interchange protein DsbC
MSHLFSTRLGGLARALPSVAAVVLSLFSVAANADEAAIRKALSERLPTVKIDEISKAMVPGLYELRMGTEVFYADEQGNFLIQGHVIDTKTKVDLTEARIEKLSAIDFASLPLKDALLIKQGSGARRFVVFADPNCGYCKHLEKDLLTMKDVSIYTFVMPILGPDSNVKARDIWCNKEPGKTWRNWMVDGTAPPKNMGKCDVAALDRNVEMGHKYRVQGTPAIVFEDGTRAPGAIPLDQIESRLAAAAAARKS